MKKVEKFRNQYCIEGIEPLGIFLRRREIADTSMFPVIIVS